MKTKNGRLYITKRERANIEELLRHASYDLAYGGDGSYWTGSDDENGHVADEHAIKRSRKAIQDIQWILDNAIN